MSSPTPARVRFIHVAVPPRRRRKRYTNPPSSPVLRYAWKSPHLKAGKRLQHSPNGDVRRVQDYVLKVSKKNSNSEEERFRDDPELAFQILKSIGPHRNVVECVEHPNPDGRLFVSATKYLAGGDLYDLTLAGGVNRKWIRAKFGCLARFLRQLHICGIAHMDLSLSKLLIDEKAKYQIRVCDFGLSLRFKRDKQGRELASRVVSQLGKAYCQDPDAWAGKKFLASQADVYSFGVCLLAVLIEDFPYSSPVWADRTFVSLYFRGEFSQYLRAPGRRSVPHSALDLVSRCVCPPERRWTMEQVCQHPYLNRSLGREYSSALPFRFRLWRMDRKRFVSA